MPMQKKRRLFALAAGCLLLPALLFSGCGQAEEGVSSAAPTTAETAPPMLSVDITALLSAEEVGDALGVEVGQPESYESGTIAHYSSADLQTTAEISLKEGERAMYDSTVAMVEDAVDSPNLGDAAVWSPQFQQLLVYGQGYMLGITVDIADKSADECLTAARQMAVLLLERL